MPYYIPEPLKEIAEQVHQGGQPTATLRTLLSWYGAQRRGGWRVKKIREALDELKIKTNPDLEWAYIDGDVMFLPKNDMETSAAHSIPQVVEADLKVESVLVQTDHVEVVAGVAIDPTFRIGRLASANRRPVSVTPEDTVSQAITIMLKNDFSQLPVMSSDRDVKGLISWKSLGSRLSLGCSCRFVREAKDRHYEVDADASLFGAISSVVEHECVLVRDSSEKISGIVTTSDLSVQFGQLGEPFLLLGEIENQIRNMISGKFAREELTTVRNPNDTSREISDPSDLTLGELLWLLADPKRWEKLGLKIDRKLFVNDLDDIRKIRNDVMHFDPDGIGEDDLAKLRTFVHFLRRLRWMGPK